MKKGIFHIFLMGVICLSFPSCHGIFEGIYDEPSGDEEHFGFIDVTAATHSGTIYVDASKDAAWLYLDMETEEFFVRDIDVDSKTIINGEPEQWDFAIHRWDVKTNGGSAMETPYTSLKDLRESGEMPAGNFVEDEMSEITIDRSKMMDGILVKMPSKVNTEISKWMNVDTSQMPPIYTKSDKVFLIKLANGKYMALFLRDYMSPTYKKGILTIDYIYPLEF